MTGSRARTVGRRWLTGGFVVLAAGLVLKLTAPEVHDLAEPIPTAIFLVCAMRFSYWRGWRHRHHQAADA